MLMAAWGYVSLKFSNISVPRDVLWLRGLQGRGLWNQVHARCLRSNPIVFRGPECTCRNSTFLCYIYVHAASFRSGIHPHLHVRRPTLPDANLRAACHVEFWHHVQAYLWARCSAADEDAKNEHNNHDQVTPCHLFMLGDDTGAWCVSVRSGDARCCTVLSSIRCHATMLRLQRIL
jgi:hypothetical protein